MTRSEIESAKGQPAEAPLDLFTYCTHMLRENEGVKSLFSCLRKAGIQGVVGANRQRVLDYRGLWGASSTRRAPRKLEAQGCRRDHQTVVKLRAICIGRWGQMWSPYATSWLQGSHPKSPSFGHSRSPSVRSDRGRPAMSGLRASPRVQDPVERAGRPGG
jgi:hypothetical protein